LREKKAIDDVRKNEKSPPKKIKKNLSQPVPSRNKKTQVEPTDHARVVVVGDTHGHFHDVLAM